VEFTPDNPGGYNNLGVVYYMMGDFENAAANYRKSLELDPRRSAYSNTGTTYYYAGNFSEAEAMFEKATEEAGADYRLWGNLGDARRFLDDMQGAALASYTKAIELAQSQLVVGGDDAEEFTNLAWYYVNIGEDETAERYLDNAASMPNRTAEQYYTTALVYTLLGKADLADTAIAKAKELGFSQVILDATPELQNVASLPLTDRN
jgi:Flp pilus assembly protein TadD